MNIGQVIHNPLFGVVVQITNNTPPMDPDIVKKDIVFDVTDKITTSTMSRMDPGLKRLST